MRVLHCPRCALRFEAASELADHLAHDHPSFHAGATTVEDDLLAACHCRHHAEPVRSEHLPAA